MNNLFDGRNPSVMNHDFSKVPHADISRSMFKRSHTHKTTFDSGYLIPVYVDEVLPADTFNMNMSMVARLATPIVPIMDNLYMDVFFFFVPTRLVWEHWQNFMGEKATISDTTEYTIPIIDWNATEPSALSIHDYFGIPIGISGLDSLNISALPFRCYNLIWNTWFRDQNLQNPVAFSTGDGPDAYDDYALLRRGKRHDYFTSCLPWPQKGTGVELPLGALAPVISGADRVFGSAETPMHMWNPLNGTQASAQALLGVTSGNNVHASTTSFTSAGYALTPMNLWADLSNATAATINSLREAFQLQRLLERDARGGTRYVEILHSHFGVQSPDARLQRPEYLGGGTIPINIHSVPQTSQTATTPLGTMAAYGFASKAGVGFSKAFVEHGYIIGMVSCRADLTYQNGLNKMWTRQTKYDFYWPSLAHLGEQAVLNSEICCLGESSDSEIFGYQERFAEYRYYPSKITALMRSNHAQSLDIWHLSQDISSLPYLDATFIAEDPPVDRVIAVPAQPHFVADMYFDLKCARPMPLYSVPGLIDHF